MPQASKIRTLSDDPNYVKFQGFLFLFLFCFVLFFDKKSSTFLEKTILEKVFVAKAIV